MQLSHQLLTCIGEHSPPAPWHEDETPFANLLYLDAATYEQPPLFGTPPAQPDYFLGNFLASPNQTMAYQNRVLRRGTPLRLLGRKEGTVVFDGDVTIPTLIDLRVHGKTGEPFAASANLQSRATWGAVWMSLTPSEMLSQRGGVRAASGKVVVGGLGLGWLLRKVCEKESVTEVVVVEKNAEVLDWYGRDLCARHAKVSDVICDDVYRHLGRHGGDTKYLLDIWFNYHDAKNDWRLRDARRRLKGSVWAWGWD